MVFIINRWVSLRFVFSSLRYLFISSSILLLLVPVAQGEFQRETQGLLSDLSKELYQNHPEMKRLEYQTQQSLYDIQEANRKLLPQLNLRGTATFQEKPNLMPNFPFSIFPNQQYGLGLYADWPLYLGGRIWNNRSIRKKSYENLKKQSEAFKQNILYDFVELLFQREELSSQKERLQTNIKRQAQFVRAVSKRSKLGNALSFELSQAQSDQWAYKVQLQDIDLALPQVLSQLSQSLGGQPLKQTDSASSLMEKLERAKEVVVDKSFLPKSLEEAQKLTMQNRKDRILAKSTREIKALQSELLMSSYRPSFIISGFGSFDSENVSGLYDWDQFGYGMTLSLSIPVFSFGAGKKKKDSIKAQMMAYDAELSSVDKSLEDQVKKVWDQWQSLNESESMISKWVWTSRQALRKAEQEFYKGRIGSTELLRMQQAFDRSADRAQIQSLSYKKATLGLARVLGLDPLKVFSLKTEG